MDAFGWKNNTNVGNVKLSYIEFLNTTNLGNVLVTARVLGRSHCICKVKLSTKWLYFYSI